MSARFPFRRRPSDNPFGRTRTSTGSLLQWGERPFAGWVRDGGEM